MTDDTDTISRAARAAAEAIGRAIISHRNECRLLGLAHHEAAGAMLATLCDLLGGIVREQEAAGQQFVRAAILQRFEAALEQ